MVTLKSDIPFVNFIECGLHGFMHHFENGAMVMIGIGWKSYACKKWGKEKWAHVTTNKGTWNIQESNKQTKLTILQGEYSPKLTSATQIKIHNLKCHEWN